MVVANDTRAQRREVQLREMVHVLLIKLDSDADASMDPATPVNFTVQGDELTRISQTAEQVRRSFKDLYARRRDTIFSRDDQDEI